MSAKIHLCNLIKFIAILTVDDVMIILQIGRNQCYELLNSGELKGFRLGTKIWQIPRKAVEDLMNASGHHHLTLTLSEHSPSNN